MLLFFFSYLVIYLFCRFCPYKRGSSVVGALASRGTGIDPRRRQGNFGVQTHFPLCHLQG